MLLHILLNSINYTQLLNVYTDRRHQFTCTDKTLHSATPQTSDCDKIRSDWVTAKTIKATNITVTVNVTFSSASETAVSGGASVMEWTGSEADSVDTSVIRHSRLSSCRLAACSWRVKSWSVPQTSSVYYNHTVNRFCTKARKHFHLYKLLDKCKHRLLLRHSRN